MAFAFRRGRYARGAARINDNPTRGRCAGSSVWSSASGAVYRAGMGETSGGVEWGKVMFGVGAAVFLVVAMLAVFNAGRQSAPRSTARPVVAPVASATPMLQPVVPPSTPTTATRHTPSDAEIAARISTLSGEELIGELWTIDQVSDPSVTYDLLSRNAARQTGKIVVFTGKVLEIQDLPQGGSFIRLGLGSYGQRPVAVFTYVAPPDDVLQNRRVRAYGTIAGTFEYTSQAGWNLSIPRLDAVAVVRDNIPRRAPRPR